MMKQPFWWTWKSQVLSNNSNNGGETRIRREREIVQKQIVMDRLCRTSSMTTTRTDTTHGPTYSMAIVIRATKWQKGFIGRCHCLYCCLPDSQIWPVCKVTGHVDLPMATYSSESQHRSKVMARVLHLSTPPYCTCPAEHIVCYTSVQQWYRPSVTLLLDCFS